MLASGSIPLRPLPPATETALSFEINYDPLEGIERRWASDPGPTVATDLLPKNEKGVIA
jgi:hypothetical protein